MNLFHIKRILLYKPGFYKNIKDGRIFFENIDIPSWIELPQGSIASTDSAMTVG
jgi:hypothetical protein